MAEVLTSSGPVPPGLGVHCGRRRLRGGNDTLTLPAFWQRSRTDPLPGSRSADHRLRVVGVSSDSGGVDCEGCRVGRWCQAA